MRSAGKMTKLLLTGAVVGGIIGMIANPLKKRKARKIRKNAGEIVHSVGNIIDGFAQMRA